MRPKSFIKRAIAVFTVSLLLVVGVSAMATGGFMTRFFDEHSSLSKTTEALENMSSAQLVKAVAAAAEEAEQNFNEENTVKKQKCPDFSIGATQKDSHGEPKISIFPPNLRVRRTCTSTYKWVDALEVDAGMP